MSGYSWEEKLAEPEPEVRRNERKDAELEAARAITFKVCAEA